MGPPPSSSNLRADKSICSFRNLVSKVGTRERQVMPYFCIHNRRFSEDGKSIVARVVPDIMDLNKGESPPIWCNGKYNSQTSFGSVLSLSAEEMELDNKFW